MKKILGIILARGGSKGIKNKNIIKFGNKPLIKWTFDAAKKTKKLSRLILSTDSKKIANLAKKNKIEVPFLRPKKLAGDNSKSIDAIEHAINFFKKQKIFFDYVVLFEPTSPLRTSIDIDKSIDQIVKSGADSLVSVCKVNE